MAAGEVFSDAQRHQIDQAVRLAETHGRFEISVYVGAVDGPAGPFARRLHASLITPERSALILVDPAARAIEIVTGAQVRRERDDTTVAATVSAMQAAFADGDLVGGITRGVHQLAGSELPPQTPPG